MGEIKYFIGHMLNGANIMGEWDEEKKLLKRCVSIIFHKPNPALQDTAIVVQTVFHPMTMQKNTVLENVPEIMKFQQIDLPGEVLFGMIDVSELRMSQDLKNAYIEAWSRIITPEERAEQEMAAKAREAQYRSKLESMMKQVPAGAENAPKEEMLLK